jgi:hypothetical protein
MKGNLGNEQHTPLKKTFMFFYVYAQPCQSASAQREMSSATILRTEEIIAGEDGIKKEV